MVETYRRRFTNEEVETDEVAEALMTAVRLRAIDHRVLATWDEDGFTLWWREEEAIDPLQVW